MEEMNISRRNFIAGAAGIGGIALATGLSSCSSPSDRGDFADESATNVAIQPVAEHEADLVIVGSGTSGLAAAVQAGCEGVSCIVIDQNSTYGGNSSAVEACFAVGDRLAEEAGVEYTVADVILRELEYGNYRADGNLWTDLVTSSEENYYWLVDQGVKFSGRVEKGSGLIPVAHVFDMSGESPTEAYTDPMYNKAVELGVEFSFSQTATSLAQDEQGNVVGVYTENADGDPEFFGAKAVILASGGYAANPELMARAGWGKKAEEFVYFAQVENRGDGFRMASALEAGDTVPHSCQINSVYIYSIGDKKTPGRTIVSDPSVIWVNGDCERFVNEDFAVKTNRQAIANPLRNQNVCYVFLDRGTLEAILSSTEGFVEQFDSVLATDPDDLFVGDSVANVAQAAGLDEDALTASVERYNEMAAAGKDAEYNKDASYLRVMDQPPFYLARTTLGTCASFGGIKTNRRYEVVKEDDSVIPGLYAIGTDGCMLYRDTYTICVPTSACAHHVNSGRKSVQNAIAYINGE